MSWTISVPAVPPSLNSLAWRQWWTRYEITQIWYKAVWALCKQQHIPLMDKVCLEATIFFKSNRKRDADNFEATLKKMFQDALVKAGIIPDDTSEYVEWGLVNLEIDPTYPRTEVVVTMC